MFKILFVLLSVLANPYGRQSTSLNGTWSAIIDQYDIGDWNGLVREAKVDRKEDFREFSYHGGLTLDVPGDWNHQSPELNRYEGTIWYARHLDYTPSAGRKILYFGAVANRCTVYINEKVIGTHEGGFSPFEFDVTDALQPGDNFLVVRTNNSRKPDAIPAMYYDWWNYGGITRDVMLVEVPEVYIADYYFRLAPGETNTVLCDVTLSQHLAGQKVVVSIPELKIKKEAVTDASGKACVSFKSKKLKLWAPGAPKLYDVEVTSESDRVTDEIGFKTITTKGTTIYVNGEPFFMKGVSFHEEIPWEMRRACTTDDAYYLVNSAKEVGCNMIRTSHYPQNEHVYRMADKLGLLVWEEIPLWQVMQFENPYIRDLSRKYLEDMILRDRNRCSIGLWSISNETFPGTVRDAFLIDLLEYGKTLDNSRLFASALNGPGYDNGVLHEEDSFAEHLDVIGINIYLGWYFKWPVAPSELKWNVFPDKPLFISEFGGEAKAGTFGRADEADSWSEDFQADLYRKNLEAFAGAPNLCGVCPWVLIDFRTPYRMQPEKQNFFNRKGLLGSEGQKKKAWYVMHDYYESR